MKSSARTLRIMEYIVSAWLLLLSFYWISIAFLMDKPDVFFAAGITTFLLGCTYFLLMLLEKLLLKKIVLFFFIAGTITVSGLALLFDPACTCNVIRELDLLPQGIGCLMAVVLLFTRAV